MIKGDACFFLEGLDEFDALRDEFDGSQSSMTTLGDVPSYFFIVKARLVFARRLFG